MKSSLKITATLLFYFSICWAKAIEERYTEASLKIIAEAMSDSTAFNRLSYLCDTFGPRLSGSKNLENAIDWIIREMKYDGLQNVVGERVRVPVWLRGKESVTLLRPFEKEIEILGVGGSIGTPKSGITSDVIVVRDFSELEQKKNQLKGKVVLFNVDYSNYGDVLKYRYSGASEAAKYGARGSLLRSITPWSVHTPNTGLLAYNNGLKKIPYASLTVEDAMMMQRLYDRGQKITIKMQMSSKLVSDRWSRNIIAELRGSTYPDEIVLLGGHIDSWDVGQGAHDDAGGCLASWEAVRLIKKLNFKPKRTIRCVLWTNEENGGRGSIAYRDMHLDELDKHIVTIVSDMGVFAPEGFAFYGSAKAKKVIEKISVLMKPINANKLIENGRTSDVLILNGEGIPSLSLFVDNPKYFWYHHSSADTFDKVDFHEFNKCVSALSIMAYVIADLNSPL